MPIRSLYMVNAVLGMWLLVLKAETITTARRDAGMKKALLALADGAVFEGRALGYEGEAVGEVVFNTAMTGYQEVLTDPSYKGQIITMTCPHIGNYGVYPEDIESNRIWAEGFVVKEASQLASNWRSSARTSRLHAGSKNRRHRRP